MPAVRPIATRSLALEAPCDLHAVREVCHRVREFLANSGLVEGELDAWELALAEAGNNAVRYATPAGKQRPVRIEVTVSEGQVEVRLTDHTRGFEFPAAAQLPDPDAESGRGLFLIQSLTDEAVYLRGAAENCLVLRKARPPGAGAPAVKSDPLQELAETRHTLDLMTEELASAFESLAAIFRFSSELHTSANSEEFTQRWLSQLLAITESDWFVLRLADPAGQALRVGAISSGEGRSEPLSLKSAGKGGIPIEIRAATERNDVWFDAKAPLLPNDPLAAFGAHSCGFAHPVFVNEALVGVLSVGRRDGERPFQAGQVNVIQTFADFLGIQIRAQQMQEEQVRARLDARDLEIAANLQRALLPEHLPSPPRVSLAGFYRSAREISGDYYDALRIDGTESVFLVVADVMGKGLPAALFAFMFRSLVRARRDLAPKPGEFLAWLNQNLFQELDRAGMFITVQLAFLDCQVGEIRVASAGHPPLLIASPAGEVSEISAGGPPLGIVAGASFPEGSHACPGGHAVMFTDGLIEARNRAGQLLGLEAVKSALASAAQGGESSEATRQRLARLLQDFEQGTSPADDTAFIVIASNTPTAHE